MRKMTLDEIKSVELEMLRYLDNICKTDHIDYMLIGGSLLGAIRHNGFIPWDDDIDIILTMENYDKLFSVLKNIKHEHFKLLHYSIQKDCYHPFMKFVDTRTCVKEKNKKEISNYGVFIDIFGYFKFPENINEGKKHFKKINYLRKNMGRCSDKKLIYNFSFKNILRIPLKIKSKVIGMNYYMNKYDKVMRKYSNTNTHFMVSNWPVYSYEHEIQEYDNLKDVCCHNFEDINALIPVQYDKILTKLYGNYMELPPVEKRISNHDMEVYWRD